jgi:soluble cytochrome b562
MSTIARMIVAALVTAAALIVSTPASAKSVREFDSLSPADQSEYMISFLEKMTADLRQKNPKLAQDIKDYFVHKQPGKPYSEGLEKVYVELASVETLAKDGKADLSKIQVESIVVYVVKQKFPPPVTAQK